MKLTSMLAASAAAALGCCGITAPAAFARPIGHEHFVEHVEYPVDDVCGDLDAAVTFDDRGNLIGRISGNNRLPRYTVKHHYSATWTNPATGKALTFLGGYTDQDLQATDNGDGTLTIVGRTGGSERSYGPDGQLLHVQSGRTDWRVLLDDAGTPTDPSDETVIDFEFLRGEHGLDFCSAYPQLTG